MHASATGQELICSISTEVDIANGFKATHVRLLRSLKDF